MESIPRKPLRAAYQCSLALLGLTCLLGTADARPMLLPSEHFPGPWLEVTQEIRDVLSLNKVSACSQAAGRESSRNPGEYLLYCTADEKLGQAGAYTPRRAPFEAQAGSSKASQCQTDIKTNQAVAVSNAVCTCSALGFEAECPLWVSFPDLKAAPKEVRSARQTDIGCRFARLSEISSSISAPFRGTIGNAIMTSPRAISTG